VLLSHGHVETGGHVGIVVPVSVVDLQLDEVDIRVLRQEALEAVRARMERETPVTDDALLLQTAYPVPQLVLVVDVVVVVLDSVEQIEVQVVGAQTLEARRELTLYLVSRGVAQPCVGLAAEGVATARVTLHQRLACGLLRTVYT
jgi:hypothetical protein